MTLQTELAQTDVVLRLVGESGEGTVSLGDLAVKMFVMMGLDIYTFQTFPAEIKGGTVMYQIRARSGVPLSHGDAADVLIALNDEGFDLFGEGLREDGILLYDSDVFTPTPCPGRTDYGLPISALARIQKEAVRHEVTPEQLKRLPAPKNMVGLGALLRLVNAPLQPAEQYIRDLFGRKGEAIVQMNICALHTGADRVAEQIGSKRTPRLFPVPRTEPIITINGNQMLAMGAIAAGMRFYAGYPITPASEIMEFLAKELPRFGGNLIQAEDEMAAIGMCLGASYAGVKSMTASAGPGISLMVEQINLAGQAEIPLVVADIQRGGASTGMPTKTSQGDLNLALYGVHNESPRIVLAAASVEDCFWTTLEAFNLAEAYQCPVLLLSDQALATRKCTLPPPDLSQVKVVNRLTPTPEERAAGYKRYADTPTGISPMSVPGMEKGVYVSTGIEHDEEGNPGYTPELASKMKAKRFRKLETLRRERAHEFVRLWGDTGDLDVGIIAFGSTEGVIREATDRARAEGYKVGHLHLRMLNPLPVESVQEFAARCRQILVPELNFTGQLAGWLRVNTDIRFHPFHKDEGIPFLPNEIYRQITMLAGQ
ncbi:MAG TPA: 2-oxoacid:acceptor oxidoreductase subunit alpha [Chthonomonadaceae bacterium]|nr:2-oxoacid:acceptor oxidoreductase subunit alpha [Chthonomonadaceae bacterium]